MFKELKYSEGKKLWDDFLMAQRTVVPATFNSELLSFYENHYKWKSYYILIKYGVKTIGVFPVVNTKKSLVSLPHFSYGGIIAIDNINIDITKLINLISLFLKGKPSGFYVVDIDKANSYISSKHKAKYFIRSLGDGEITEKHEKVSSIMEIPSTTNELDKVIDSNLRRKVRKSFHSDITIKTGKDELIDDFYKVYINNITNLRSMPYGKSFFQDLILSWNTSYSKVTVAYDSNKPIAGGIVLGYCNFFENTYFSTLKEYRKSYISDRLHYQMITDIISTIHESSDNKQKPIYSFGRSTYNSGVFKYKNHWPVKNLPLNINTDQQLDLKKGITAKIWRNMPSVIRNTVGPLLVKDVY